MGMLSLEQDFPDIADEIIVAARSHAALRDALIDYERACEHASDIDGPAADRIQWAEMRSELVAEIRRIFSGLDQFSGPGS